MYLNLFAITSGVLPSSFTIQFSIDIMSASVKNETMNMRSALCPENGHVMFM